MKTSSTVFHWLCALAAAGGFHQSMDAQTIVRAVAAQEDLPMALPVLQTGSSPASSFSATVDPVSAFPEGITVQVFPNPASEWIQITTDRAAEGYLLGASLVNGMGQTVESAIPHLSSNLSIGVSHLPAGSYRLLILTANGWITRKVDII